MTGYNSCELTSDFPPAATVPTVSANASCEEHSLSPLVAGMVLLLGASVIQRLIGFIRATLFCRWLDASQLGLWDMAFGFLMTAAPLVVLALPACLGRYVEFFRRRGRLGDFLRLTASLHGALAVLGGGVLALAARPAALIVFGDPEHVPIVYELAVALVAVAAFNYVYELAMAMRLNRWISVIQLINSLLFAVLGLGLLITWRTDVQAVIIAYTVACAGTSLIAAIGMRPWRWALEDGGPSLPVGSFWKRILRYSLSVWIAGAVSNFFAVADRYMILHWLPREQGNPLATIGDYHASRLVPMLFVSLAGLLAAMSTPHLSRAWEAGEPGRAGRYLNFLAKLLSLGLLGASAGVLLSGPALFETLLAGKYPGGLEILPMTLAYCGWFSLFLLLQNYVFCWEKAYFAGIALTGGLLLNVILNSIWLPLWGLRGAVAATVLANGTALAILAVTNIRLGQAWDRGMTLAVLAPGVIALGTWPTIGLLVLLLLLSLKTEVFLNFEEKQQLWALLRSFGKARKNLRSVGPADGNGNTLQSCKPGSSVEALPRRCREAHLQGERATPEDWPETPSGRAWSNPFFSRRRHPPLGCRGPLRVMFIITCMPVGGAERLLVEIVRRLDRRLFAPELCCLKYLGPLGERLAREIPAFSGLLAHKYDLRVVFRLYRLLRRRRIDAVITVGTGGDKMFWGRLAAYAAGVPVIASALHSTGLPDRVERLNRLLTPLTDAFIAVGVPHAEYIVQHEGCPRARTWVIPNGVDTDRFSPRAPDPAVRAGLGLEPHHRVVSLIAALRREKNHELFLQAAGQIRDRLPEARFLIVGDGPRRNELEALTRQLGLEECVRFTGNRDDIPEILACTDVAVLTSHMEANPLTVLEALACGKPVVATAVGCVPLHVRDGETGFLVPPGDGQAFAERCLKLLMDPELSRAMGRRGRAHVVRMASLHNTVAGYQRLVLTVYARKCGAEASWRDPTAEVSQAGQSIQVATSTEVAQSCHSSRMFQI